MVHPNRPMGEPADPNRRSEGGSDRSWGPSGGFSHGRAIRRRRGSGRSAETGGSDPSPIDRGDARSRHNLELSKAVPGTPRGCADQWGRAGHPCCRRLRDQRARRAQAHSVDRSASAAFAPAGGERVQPCRHDRQCHRAAVRQSGPRPRSSSRDRRLDRHVQYAPAHSGFGRGGRGYRGSCRDRRGRAAAHRIHEPGGATVLSPRNRHPVFRVPRERGACPRAERRMAGPTCSARPASAQTRRRGPSCGPAGSRGRLSVRATGGWTRSTPRRCSTPTAIAVARSVRVRTPDEAEAAQVVLGCTVAVKLAAAIHKSDVGGVRLGVATPTGAARCGTGDPRRPRIGRAGRSWPPSSSCRSRSRSGQEMIVGVNHDPLLGPLVMVGLGGTLVELLDDVAARIAPLSDVDIDDMLGR